MAASSYIMPGTVTAFSFHSLFLFFICYATAMLVHLLVAS